MNLMSFKQFLCETKYRKKQTVKSGTPIYTSSHQDIEGTWYGNPRRGIAPDTFKKINVTDITRVSEPDEEHRKQPGTPEKIEKITARLKTGARMPAILVQPNEDGGYTVMDGHHRFAAYKAAGRKNIPVRIANKANTTDITKEISQQIAAGKNPDDIDNELSADTPKTLINWRSK